MVERRGRPIDGQAGDQQHSFHDQLKQGKSHVDSEVRSSSCSGGDYLHDKCVHTIWDSAKTMCAMVTNIEKPHWQQHSESRATVRDVLFSPNIPDWRGSSVLALANLSELQA